MQHVAPGPAPSNDVMDRTPKHGDVKTDEGGEKLVYREKPEAFGDCTWHCGEYCTVPCGIYWDTISQIQAENQGLLLMTEDQAQECKKIFKDHPEVTGIHPGMKCDGSGQSPILGDRYHLRDGEKNLCQAEYDKLPEAEKVSYEAIPPPVRNVTSCWQHGPVTGCKIVCCLALMAFPSMCSMCPYLCCVHLPRGRFCPGRQCPCLAACGRPSPSKASARFHKIDSIFLSEKSVGPGWTCGARHLFDDDDEEVELDGGGAEVYISKD